MRSRSEAAAAVQRRYISDRRRAQPASSRGEPDDVVRHCLSGIHLGQTRLDLANEPAVVARRTFARPRAPTPRATPATARRSRQLALEFARQVKFHRRPVHNPRASGPRVATGVADARPKKAEGCVVGGLRLQSHGRRVGVKRLTIVADASRDAVLR